MNAKQTCTFREAGRDDRDRLVELLLRQLADQDISIDRAPLQRAVEGVLDDAERGFLLLAQLDGQTVGVAYVSFMWSMEHGGRCAWLEELYVLPEYRDRGLGTALLEEAMRRAAASGCAAMDLEVAEHNGRVEALYRRHRFEFLGRRRWARRLGD